MRFHDRLLGPRWRSHHGHQALVDGFVAPLRPCAARAALREQALLLHLFRASYVCAIAWSALLFGLGLGQGRQVHGLGFSGALETARRPRGASRASPLLHLFRASYVCGIALTALLVWLEIGSGLPGAWLKVSGALETVRRPRGASRASPLLHLFRASYVCAIAWSALLVGLGLGQGCQVHGSRFPAPLRPCAARAALREQALLQRLFRASYVCGIALTALLVWLGIGSGLPGAWLKGSGALEIELQKNQKKAPPWAGLRYERGSSIKTAASPGRRQRTAVYSSMVRMSASRSPRRLVKRAAAAPLITR